MARVIYAHIVVLIKISLTLLKLDTGLHNDMHNAVP